MADDWQAGDLALCVDATTPTDDGFVPETIREGEIYTVYATGTDPLGALGLFLDEQESIGFAGGYLAWRFIKVTPRAPDKFDREVIELLTGTPTKQPA